MTTTHTYTYHGPPVALQLRSGRVVEVTDGDNVEADEANVHPSLTAKNEAAKQADPATKKKPTAKAAKKSVAPNAPTPPVPEPTSDQSTITTPAELSAEKES